MVIDFHTHAFPDKIAARTIAILENNIARISGVRANAVRTGDIQGLQDLMARDGVDISVVLPIATTPSQSASILRFAAELNGQPGLISFGSVHPMQEDWEAVLEQIKAMGLCGIKLHPEYQDSYIDGEASLRILKKCAELDLVVVLHAGKDIGMPPPVHCTPERIYNAIDKVPEVKIVAAHMGGWQMWDEVEQYLVGTPVYMDTSFSITQMPIEQARRIIAQHGSDKFLFGTDSPWEAPRDTLAALERLALSPTDGEKIRWKNAQKLLKLDEMA